MVDQGGGFPAGHQGWRKLRHNASSFGGPSTGRDSSSEGPSTELALLLPAGVR